MEVTISYTQEGNLVLGFWIQNIRTEVVIQRENVQSMVVDILTGFHTTEAMLNHN